MRRPIRKLSCSIALLTAASLGGCHTTEYCPATDHAAAYPQYGMSPCPQCRVYHKRGPQAPCYGVQGTYYGTPSYGTQMTSYGSQPYDTYAEPVVPAARPGFEPNPAPPAETEPQVEGETPPAPPAISSTSGWESEDADDSTWDVVQSSGGDRMNSATFRNPVRLDTPAFQWVPQKASVATNSRVADPFEALRSNEPRAEAKPTRLANKPADPWSEPLFDDGDAEIPDPASARREARPTSVPPGLLPLR